MASVRRNILSNFGERVASTLLTLLLVPIQVRILGIETFGLLGFLASLQTLFNILDLGLGTTVTREVAADTDPGRSASRAVVRTLATVYWTITIGIGAALALGARWLAVDWLRAGAGDAEAVAAAIRLVAISVALRWPVALYAGVLSGVQRLDVLNLVRIAGSILRLAGGLVVILATRSLVAYLVWLAVAAVLEIALYVVAARRVTGDLSLRPGFSAAAVQRVWRFSLGMNAISMLVLIVTQSDRLLIARLAPMQALGHYSLAQSLATGLSILHAIVTTALFPALARGVTRGDDQTVLSQQAKGARLLLYLVSLPAAIFVFYGHDVLALWVSAEAADAATRPLAILAIGSWLNAVVAVPYTLSIAAGSTRAAITVNAWGAMVYLPLLYLSIRRFGIEGAAWMWVALNLYYVAVLLPWVLRAIARERVVPWLLRNVAPFALAGLACLAGARAVAAGVGGDGFIWRLAMGGIGAALYTAAGFVCLGAELRRQVGVRLRRRTLAEEASAA